jgi:hypothetical protein
MIDARYKTVHRFMPATERSGAMTACGIKLASSELFCSNPQQGRDEHGSLIAVSTKGQPFDCKPSRVVLERHHADRMTV